MGPKKSQIDQPLIIKYSTVLLFEEILVSPQRQSPAHESEPQPGGLVVSA